MQLVTPVTFATGKVSLSPSSGSLEESRDLQAFLDLALARGGRLLRQLQKQLRSADDIPIQNNLRNGVGFGYGVDPLEKFGADRVVFDVEGEVRDLLLRELVFELFACGAPLGDEGDDAGRGWLSGGFEKVDALLLGREELLRGQRLPGPDPHEAEHCYQKGVSK